MIKIYYMMMMAVTLTMLWGCSSSDDDDIKENTGLKYTGNLHGIKVADPPKWTFNPTAPAGDIEGMPNWKEVDFYDYDNNMTAIVFISELFDIEVTEGDRMAAIINGEVREVCEPVVYDIPDVDEPLLCFMLYIPYVAGDGEVELQYYNAKKNQTYVEKGQFNVNDDTVGGDELFLFSLRPMGIRYFVLPSNIPFTPSLNDEMAVFIGDECCGVATLDEDYTEKGVWTAIFFDMNRTNEKAYVRYYSDELKTIFETKPYLDIISNPIVADLDTLRFK